MVKSTVCANPPQTSKRCKNEESHSHASRRLASGSGHGEWFWSKGVRISIVGTSGAGKTTLAIALAEKLGIPRIELDALNWEAGWRDLQTHDPEEFKRRTETAVSSDAWVCDGNYSMVRPIVLGRATHLIWLDYERPLIMWRVITRSFSRAVTGEALFGGGNHENFRHWLDKEHPIRWAWDTHYRRRTEYETLLAGSEFSNIKVLRLRNAREAKDVESRLRSA
jgi:adenylate kinase family enzyme